MCSINQTQTDGGMKQPEKCTKRTRKGHGSDTVFATSESTTPTPARTCAATKNILPRPQPRIPSFPLAPTGWEGQPAPRASNASICNTSKNHFRANAPPPHHLRRTPPPTCCTPPPPSPHLPIAPSASRAATKRTQSAIRYLQSAIAQTNPPSAFIRLHLRFQRPPVAPPSRPT